MTSPVVLAAIATASPALVAQTFAAGSDIAVQVFLAVGVGLSVREPDESHPFGYGRERYFWSLFGALATVALAPTQATGSRWPDAIASGVIGVALMAAAVVLTQTNRSLLTGRGVHPHVLEWKRS